ncbi:hypothetical protein, partial [Klebsiella pneumoniae]|uniref:hypothetical protein n=1 Tax=Klebsiella pneumoniae TaxID=573 RepID=UPI003630451A
MSIRLKDKPSLASRIEKFNKHHVFHENSVTHCRDYLIKMMGTVAKLAMRQPFVLFKGLTFQKLCLP